MEALAGTPLLPALQESLHTLYLAKGALATTAIEGNTLTEAQALAKTVTRDLNALAQLELIARPGRDRVVANRGALAAYLPLTERGRPTPS